MARTRGDGTDEEARQEITLAFAAAISSAGIDPAETFAIRHANVRAHGAHEDGTCGIHRDSSDEESMAYTRVQ